MIWQNWTFDSDKRTLWKYFSLLEYSTTHHMDSKAQIHFLDYTHNWIGQKWLGVAQLLNLLHFGTRFSLLMTSWKLQHLRHNITDLHCSWLPCCHTLHILWNWSPTTQGQSMQRARYSVPAQRSIELRLYCSTAIILKVTALTIISECFQLGAYQTWKNTNVGKYIHAIGITAISCDLHCLDHFAYCFSVWDLFSYICLLVIVIFIVCFLLFLLWPKFANYCEIVNNPYMWSSSALCMPQRPRDRM